MISSEAHVKRRDRTKEIKRDTAREGDGEKEACENIKKEEKENESVKCKSVLWHA